MTNLKEVSKADSGIGNRHSHQKVPGARVPQGCGGGGGGPGQGPPGAITVAEGRDAESWFRIATERVDTRFSSDTKSTGLSDQMGGDDQEVTKVFTERTGEMFLSASDLYSDCDYCVE